MGKAAETKKRGRGRPSKYRPWHCDSIVQFFSRPLYIKSKVTNVVNGKKEVSVVTEPNSTPYLIDWVIKHGLHSETPSEWGKRYPDFSVALNMAKRLQERFLVELGIKGEHNAFMTFQTLKNVDCLWGRDGTDRGWIEVAKNINLNGTPDDKKFRDEFFGVSSGTGAANK